MTARVQRPASSRGGSKTDQLGEEPMPPPIDLGSAAHQLRRRRPRPGDKWHLDELVVSINGGRRYLWRAVDQRGMTRGVLVTRRRDAHAARRFLRKLLAAEQYVPRVLITTSSAPTARPDGMRCPASSTGAAGTSTTGWKTPTSGPGCGNGRCAGSTHPDTSGGSATPTT